MSLTAITIAPHGPHDLPPPSSRVLRNGNPSGNPNAAPRCGAKNRAGCPCRAPAMSNGRCRLHGGKSTGPRTPEGRARSAAARITHGNTTASERTWYRHVRTVIRRNRLTCQARLLWPYLPPAMSDRLAKGPKELWALPHPSNLPYVQTPDPSPPLPAQASRPSTQSGAPTRRLPRALAAERAAARAEAAALAPWREAIAHARTAKRDRLAANRAHRAARRTARAANRAARLTSPTPQALLPAAETPWTEYTPLERELAARLAGLRAQANQLDQVAPLASNPDPTFLRINPLNPEPAAAPAQNPNSTLPRINLANPEPTATPIQNPNSTLPRINPMNPEPTAAPTQNANSRLPRINPLNPEPTATPTPNPNSTLPRINPMNPEPTAASTQNPTSPPSRTNPMNPEPPSRPRPTRRSPTRALALRSTTQSNTWQPTLHAMLAARLARPSRAIEPPPTPNRLHEPNTRTTTP